MATTDSVLCPVTDMMSRVPPQCLGIIPNNAGGFGDVTKAGEIFFHHEIRPLMTVFDPINDWAGEKVVAFKDYEPLSA